MVIDGYDFYLALLLYHRRLRCLVAIELKPRRIKAAPDLGAEALLQRKLPSNVRKRSGDYNSATDAIQIMTMKVSVASVWEIATNYRLGKLPVADKAIRQFHSLVEADGFKHLLMTWQHSLLAGSYNNEYLNLFNRILAAQSEIEKALLVTCDVAFAGFGPAVLWQ